MDHKAHIKGDYVLSPCKNSFNNKTSYWISKKGYMIAVYAFTPMSQRDLDGQIEQLDQYIKVFETALTKMKNSKNDVQDCKERKK